MSNSALYDPSEPHWLRRPSTVLSACAGLLAADPLRWLAGSWAAATLTGLAAVLAVAWARQRLRDGRRYAVAVLLPPSSPPLCDRNLPRHPGAGRTRMRHPLVLFLLFVFALFLVPVLFQHLP